MTAYAGHWIGCRRCGNASTGARPCCEPTSGETAGDVTTARGATSTGTPAAVIGMKRRGEHDATDETDAAIALLASGAPMAGRSGTGRVRAENVRAMSVCDLRVT